MLELSDIHVFYKESHIVRGISLFVEEASIVGLLGRNGMGKTTTIRSIIGLTPPRFGVIKYRKKEIQGLPPYKICQMGIGLVPQGRRIFPSLTVDENLRIGARPNGWSLEKVHSIFPILKARAKHKGNNLSGGEQQMLCIARSLLTNPDFLLMDEPSEGLAPLIIKEISKVISQLKNEKLSILLVEQNLNLALSVCDLVYILYHGKIVFEGSTRELTENVQLQTQYIGVGQNMESLEAKHI